MARTLADGQLDDGCTQTAKNTDKPATGQKTGVCE